MSNKQQEPSINRSIKGGKSVTLKISIGRKVLESDEELARMMYRAMLINGAQYCRPHLLERCHLCETDTTSMNEEVNEERRELGLRPGGDAGLNARSKKWGELTLSKIMQRKAEVSALIEKYGPNHARTHLQHWQKFMIDAKIDEVEVNNEFLADIPEVSQCCYWNCEQPDSSNLLRCAGCGIVKYCCKDHQVKDWKWEHKGECQLPEFLEREYAEKRRRNLAGDYS